MLKRLKLRVKKCRGGFSFYAGNKLNIFVGRWNLKTGELTVIGEVGSMKCHNFATAKAIIEQCLAIPGNKGPNGHSSRNK